ncbi:hypothetical protein ACFQE1_01555 [Halobium palmae]|uniref:Uncharacterized protein n=1 Tax=Halobium palmae TaxID=1776492 RepID=A0ABD5RWH0_9EURY
MHPDARAELTEAHPADWFAEEYKRFTNYSNDSLWSGLRNLSHMEQEVRANSDCASPRAMALANESEQAREWWKLQARIVLISCLLAERQGYLYDLPWFERGEDCD